MRPEMPMSGRPLTAEECVKGQDAARKALDRCLAADATTWAEWAEAMIRAIRRRLLPDMVIGTV